MTQHNQFIRKARLRVGNDTEGVDLSDLQFSFQIRQAQLSTPQFMTVRIYNMSAATAQKIKLNEYTRIILQAGYQQGGFGVIFDGELIQARLGRESAVDTYFDVIAATGYAANQSTMNATLAAGSTALDVAEAAASAMGRPLINYATKPPAKNPRGMAMYGMARDVLSWAASTMEASWYYTPNGIELVPLGGMKPTAAAVISASTGMVGWPEQTQDGIKVRCLLNPLLDVGSPLKIDNGSILRAQPSADIRYINNLPSTNADGLYRICVIEHRGNTRGNDWYSDIICVGIDPANFGMTGLVQKGQF